MKTNSNPEELELQGDQLQPAMHEHGGLTITTQEIISIINEVLIFKGIKAALLKYEDMCVTYAKIAGWNIIAQELSKWLAREIENRRTAKHKKQNRGRKRKQRTDNITFNANQIILGNTIDIHQTDEKQGTAKTQRPFIDTQKPSSLKADLDKLYSAAAQRYWARLQEYRFVDERYRPLPEITRKQEMYIAEAFAEKLNLRFKWKTFQYLWNISNLAQEKWDIQQTGLLPMRHEEIDAIFKD